VFSQITSDPALGWLQSIFFPSPEDGNRSSFRNVVFFLSLFLIPGRWIKSKNPISLKVIHHHQNPIVTKEGLILYDYNELYGSLVSDDFRIFCGDLGNDVTDEILTRAFSKYQSFLKAKVVRDKRSNKTKGFGFVSFKDPQDFIKAMKEMNGE
jgi:hypothetical protein